jgi:hypothetical protein
VLTGGIVADWGLDKAILSLCAARICRMVLAEIVRIEVERNLLARSATFPDVESGRILDDYAGLVKLARPEVVPVPAPGDVARSLSLIRHAADVPVLLSAIQCRPDWLLTNNTKHFNAAVAKRTGLRIATPSEFFGAMAASLQPGGWR